MICRENIKFPNLLLPDEEMKELPELPRRLTLQPERDAQSAIKKNIILNWTFSMRFLNSLKEPVKDIHFQSIHVFTSLLDGFAN